METFRTQALSRFHKQIGAIFSLFARRKIDVTFSNRPTDLRQELEVQKYKRSSFNIRSARSGRNISHECQMSVLQQEYFDNEFAKT